MKIYNYFLKITIPQRHWHTTCRSNTALCVTSRGKKAEFDISGFRKCRWHFPVYYFYFDFCHYRRQIELRWQQLSFKRRPISLVSCHQKDATVNINVEHTFVSFLMVVLQQQHQLLRKQQMRLQDYFLPLTLSRRSGWICISLWTCFRNMHFKCILL